MCLIIYWLTFVVNYHESNTCFVHVCFLLYVIECHVFTSIPFVCVVCDIPFNASLYCKVFIFLFCWHLNCFPVNKHLLFLSLRVHRVLSQGTSRQVSWERLYTPYNSEELHLRFGIKKECGWDECLNG